MVKCECCLKVRPLYKDFRERDGTLHKFRVCSFCFNLHDIDFWELYDNPEEQIECTGEPYCNCDNCHSVRIQEGRDKNAVEVE